MSINKTDLSFVIIKIVGFNLGSIIIADNYAGDSRVGGSLKYCVMFFYGS